MFELRVRAPGFHNCALCQNSSYTSSYTCPVTGAVAVITQHITCRSSGVYLIYCSKDTGACARLRPTYLWICGEGEHSTFTSRLGQHLGTSTQVSQVVTVTPVGRHFRLPGHKAHRDLVMTPLEAIINKCY